MIKKRWKSYGSEKLFWIQSFLAVCMLIVTVWGVIINIKSNKVSQQQLKLIREQEEWAKYERERKANLYLEVRDVEKELPDRIKLRFTLYNSGNKIAEKVQIRWFFSQKDDAKGEKMGTFSSDKETIGLKYSLDNMGERIVYYQKEGNETYCIKLSCVLNFRIPNELSIKDSIELPYFIDCSEGSEGKITKFKNPYYVK